MTSRIAFPALFALLCASSTAALAAGPDNLDIGDAMLRPASSTTKEIGIGVAVAPPYVGAYNHKTYGYVDVEANFGNGLFVSSKNGFGYRFLETPSGWSMATSLSASPSRREKDAASDPVNRMNGMGDVNAKVQANLFLNYDNGPFHANAALGQTLAARRGTQLDLSVGYDLFADPNNLVRATAGMVYANRNLMQTFYGVTPQQAARSGNWVYSPHAGIAALDVGVNWRHAFSEHWVGDVGVGAARLHGDALDSPMRALRNGVAVEASLSYRF